MILTTKTTSKNDLKKQYLVNPNNILQVLEQWCLSQFNKNSLVIDTRGLESIGCLVKLL